jgi:GDP-D-mannose dehydratase
VVATDTCFSVKEFLVKTFTFAGYSNLSFEGTGIKERLLSNTLVLAKVDPKYLRPGEVPHLLGASEKIKKELGWVQ